MSDDYISGRATFPGGSAPGAQPVLEGIDFDFDGLSTSTEKHGVDVNYAGELAAGGALVGLDVAVTPTGEAGSWVAAVFGKVTEVAAAGGPVAGYFCGAEFEVNITGAQPSAWAVLVLNANHDGSTYGQTEAYVFLREYGSKAVRSLFNFMDHSRESENNAVIVSQTGSKPFDTAIRCTIGSAGTTGLWLLASSVGPADADIDFKMLGSAATNYIEYDASEDQFNIIVASRTITGKDIALNISMAGTVGASDYIIGLKSDVTPDGGGAIYGMAIQGILNLTDKSVHGYACAAEFRLVTSGSGWNLCDNGVLVLAADVDHSGSPPNSVPYIMLREYGTYPANAMVRFFDHTRATASDSVILSQMGATPFDTAVRCVVGTTPFWLYGSTVGPASLADLKWLLGSSSEFINCDVTNSRVELAKVSLYFSGTLTGKGINFNDATHANLGGSDSFLSIGDGTSKDITIADYFFPIRVNLTSVANPGTEKLFAELRLQFAQSTEAQGNLDVCNIQSIQTLSQDLSYVHNFDVYTAVGSAIAVTTDMSVINATLLNTGIATGAGWLAVIRACVSGAATPAGWTYTGVLFLDIEDGAVGIASGILVDTHASGTLTDLIRVPGSGAITNVFNFSAPNGATGAKVGAVCDTEGVDSDGALRILVNGIPYYIPFFTAGNTAGSW